jgi:alkylation response protein AidB-like acyl-CoA dehydrogenase
MIGALVADEVSGFRQQVSEFLAETSTARDPMQYFKDRSGVTAELYRELGNRGWLSISWPPAEGGLGKPASFEFALWDEMAYARAARPPIAAGIVARSIIEHATDSQKARLLPGIAAGTLSFALGYSEPEAGSDLAGLRTRAQIDGESYIVTGEKRWTSDAHHADYLWLLCRTGALENRARDLTLMVVDLASPNIETFPIETLDGHQVNEVRLEEVIVPIENRIGEEGRAWEIIQQALARERHLQILPGRLRRDFDELVRWAEDSGTASREDVRERLALMAAGIDAVSATARKIVEGVSAGADTSVLAAGQKIVGTSLMQEIARFPLAWGDTRQLIGDAPFEFMWRECVLETIAGGTSEVMAGIIARHALGLWA